MNATSEHLPEPDDLESTAELPVLDEFAVGRLNGETTQSIVVSAAGAAAGVRPVEEQLRSQVGALQVELTGARTANTLYEARVQELEEIIRARDSQLQEANERETGLRAELARKDQDTQVLLAQREAQLRMDTGLREAANARLYHDLEEARIRAAAQLEALQSLEARRGLFEAQLQQLDEQLNARELKVGQLASEVDHGNTHAGELELELESRALRIKSLENELARLSTSLGTSAGEADVHARENEELRSTIRQLMDQAAMRAAQVSRVEQEAAARLQAQAESQHAAADAHRTLERAYAQLKELHAAALAELAQLHEQTDEHVVAVQQVTAQHANRLAQIAASEARARELAAQLERRDRDVGEMTQTITDLKAQLEEAQKWRQERDSMMQHLETEAVHSQALVDNIRRSIRQLGSGTGSTMPHEMLKEGARLLVRMENGQEVIHVLGRRTAIGRTSDNDLQIDAGYISRHHALIMTSATQAVIEDLGSTNGVHVNGRKITRQLLKDGDAVLIGRMLFRYVVQPSAESPQAEPH